MSTRDPYDTAHSDAPRRGIGLRHIGRARWHYAMLTAILIAHCVLAAHSAAVHGPAWDETGHLAGGAAIWQFGRFDLYRVNPPLVRVIASVPIVLCKPEVPWEHYVAQTGNRAEFTVGRSFVYEHGRSSNVYFVLGRWACLPLSVVGGLVCHAWARRLYGAAAGLAAASLWSFSPTVLAYVPLITPDAGAAALGVMAGYAFWLWLVRPSWGAALIAGTALGLALLTKFTWVIAIVLWPGLWLAHRGLAWRRRGALKRLRHEALQGSTLLLAALLVVNLGYGFTGTGTSLGELPLLSQALSPPLAEDELGHRRNRFTGTLLGDLPLPIPPEYLQGIDQQKLDFEKRLDSFLGGEWRKGGWWHYYLYALGIKEPLGLWILVALATAALLRGQPRLCRNEILLLPGVALLAFVSSQTGFNHHIRYVLPALPFLYIWVSRAHASKGKAANAVASWGAWGALGWFVAAGVWSHPHQHSYFNEWVGGPGNGFRHLSHSNTDWGQDMLLAARWVDTHPRAHPLFVATVNAYALDAYGIVYAHPPLDPDMPYPRELPLQHAFETDKRGPQPGWYIISVNALHAADGRYAYLLDFPQADQIGYSLRIYELTAAQCEAWWHARGQPSR